MKEVQDKATRYPDLHQMCLKGLVQRLADAFGLPDSSVVFFSGTNRMAVAQQVAKNAGLSQGLVMPLLLIHMDSVNSGIGQDLHGVNVKSLARHGLYTQMDENTLAIRKVGIVGAVFDMEVIFMSDTFDKAFNFACQWVACSVHNRLNFTLTYGSVGIDIRCEMSANVPTPDKEESVDNASLFEYSAGLRLVGYISDHHLDADNKIGMVHTVKANMYVADDPEMPGVDPAVYSDHHVMQALKDGDVK